MLERERIIEEIRIRDELRLRKNETWWQRLRRQVENARKNGVAPDPGELAATLAAGRSNTRAYYAKKEAGDPLGDEHEALEARRGQLAKHFEQLLAGLATPTAPMAPQQGPQKAAELPHPEAPRELEIPRGFELLKKTTRIPKPVSVWH